MTLRLADPEERARFAATITEPGNNTAIPIGTVPLAGWRWFAAGEHIVLEPIAGVVAVRDMTYLDRYPRTIDIEAVFLATPHPGVYLRFKLAADSPEPPR